MRITLLLKPGYSDTDSQGSFIENLKHEKTEFFEERKESPAGKI